MKVKIYVLIDPLTSKIRYIGRTTNSLSLRLNGHLSKAKLKQNHKDCWILHLLKKGEIPKIKLFKEINGWTESHQYEKSLIKKAIEFGFDLVNLDDRGEGGINKLLSKDARVKISNSLKESYKNGKAKITKKRSISAFTLEGEFIERFETIKECSSKFNIPYSSLECIFSKKLIVNKGFQFTCGENPGKFVKIKKIKDYSFNFKPVFLYNIITKETFHFASFKEVAYFLNCSSPTIRRKIESKEIFKNYQISMPHR